MNRSKVKSILPKPSSQPLGLASLELSNQNYSPAIKRRATAPTNSLPTTTTTATSPRPRKQRKASVPASTSIDEYDMDLTAQDYDAEYSGKESRATGHRPVTSCTFCRQHKIKCNASDNYPDACTRCQRMGLRCEIDPAFRPKKGLQIQSLKNDVDSLREKIDSLTKNESLLTQALAQHNMFMQMQMNPAPPRIQLPYVSGSVTPNHVPSMNESPSTSYFFNNRLLNDATTTNLPSHTQSDTLIQDGLDVSPAFEDPVPTPDFPRLPEFKLGDVTISLERAEQLHHTFMTKLLPFMPIVQSACPNELYHKLQLLFWLIMLIASLSDPEPTLYMLLATLIKQLAIETCWIRTPRLTHVVQALILLSIWPMPNQKVLDDISYRFVGLAKNLSLQLGLHRGGDFILEFSRTQVNLGPDAERWRTRLWLAIYFCEQFWLLLLGLPPSITTTDYLLENARVDVSLPRNFRNLISLLIFQCKLVNVMGISVTRPDGLLDPQNRALLLNVLDRELDRLRFKLHIDSGLLVETYFLYIKLTLCCFAFLPGTPIEDQVKYVSSAYLAATRIITIVSSMVQDSLLQLTELPIYVRQAMSTLVLLLFKLHLSRYLLDKYVDSARQLIVTVHRLLRNTLSSWKDMQNDISRTARVLENLNIVLYSHPEIFVDGDLLGGSIISRMRSHLTASLFYDLVWCIHEARRRTIEGKPPAKDDGSDAESAFTGQGTLKSPRPLPLPFINTIYKDDFRTIATTSPNGTTVTTLVPTESAMVQARLECGPNVDQPVEIKGVPYALLKSTGLTKDQVSGMRGTVMAQNNPYLSSVEHLIKSETGTELHANLSTPELHHSYPSPLAHGVVGAGLPLAVRTFGGDTSSSVMHAPVDIIRNDSPNTYLAISEPFATASPTQMYHSGNQSHHIQDHTQMPQPPNNQVGPPRQPPNLSQPLILNLSVQMDNFFQRQLDGWLNNNTYQDDDFLGWFDVNVMPDQS